MNFGGLGGHLEEEDNDNEARESLRKKIEQYQKAQEAEKKLRSVLSQILETAAYERMANVRIANSELYANTANAVVYYYQKLKRKITENELLTLLAAQTAKKEGSIEIKRK
jgi:DNA-binding TFAR19-related protein (PDSD5 family)